MTAPMARKAAIAERVLDELTIEDESSFEHVALYGDLKAVLRKARCTFRVLPEGSAERWDRALLLNLTYWGATGGGDVLLGDHLPADVVAHVAWHHLAAAALVEAPGVPLSADALFFGEAIASAFDLYLVGRLMGHAPESSFLETQVPAMADAASAAGLDDDSFSALLQSVAEDPERAFEDLRQLLFDATTALVACGGVEEAFATLERFETHRFGALLHHYELSNWVLYARAYAKTGLAPDARVRTLDRALREAPVSLDWLCKTWLEAS